MEEINDTHETYAMASIHRVTGPVRLFGSPLLDHSSSIVLKVKKCQIIRDNGEIRYYDSGNIVQIEMSETQFASLITNMNSQGAPCTLRALENHRTEPVPRVKQEFEVTKDHFEDRLKKVNMGIKGASRLANELSIRGASKKQLIELANLLKSVDMEYTQNMPYVLELFNEAAHKTISAAKTEVDAFINNTLANMGLTALKEGIKTRLMGFEE
jgi:hypothetical protein